ncbi:MAG: ABC transporter ATP-binding protein [Dissulfurimicrobium sp.]
MFKLKGITIKAGGFAVKDVDLSIAPGTCHVIIGPTGCGKTTLLETIVGLRRPDAGEIWLEDRLISDLPIHKRGIAYLPQDLALFPHLTVHENIFYGLRVRKDRDKGHRKFVLELAEDLGITPLLHRPITHLSGGERQRVALIRALATGSRYLLLDEPFSALHEAMKKDLWFLVDELKRRLGIAIVMVSHDMEETFFLGDVISVMINGTICQTGAKEEVYNRPSDIHVARFFGIKNLFQVEVIETAPWGIGVRCDELGCDLAVSSECLSDISGILPGSSLTIGIRSENVMLIRPGLEGKRQNNLLSGMITKVFPRGSFVTAIFLPHGAKRSIEVNCPAYAAKKLDIKTNMPSHAALPSEKIFLAA